MERILLWGLEHSLKITAWLSIMSESMDEVGSVSVLLPLSWLEIPWAGENIFYLSLTFMFKTRKNEPSWRKQLCFKNETCVHVPQKPRLLKSWSRKCLVYVLTVKQNKTYSRPNELLTALAPTWPHENITAELYRLLQIWSIAKNNMWTRTSLFQSTHLFFLIMIEMCCKYMQSTKTSWSI